MVNSMENSGSPASLGDKTNTTNGGKQNKSSFYYIIKFSILFQEKRLDGSQCLKRKETKEIKNVEKHIKEKGATPTY